MPADRPQYRLCPHPGELARRVMSTHPASVNADSTAGERRLTENGRVRTRKDAPRGATETISVVKSATSDRFMDSWTGSVISA